MCVVFSHYTVRRYTHTATITGCEEGKEYTYAVVMANKTVAKQLSFTPPSEAQDRGGRVRASHFPFRPAFFSLAKCQVSPESFQD